MRLAHGVAERICAGIAERGDVKNFAAAAAAGELAETFRAGKSENLAGLRGNNLRGGQNGGGEDEDGFGFND